MILTVTLNTAIDKAYKVESFQPGQVIRVKDAKYSAGGKGLNVTRVITTLGEPVLAIGFSGGYAGMFVESELNKAKIPHQFVRIQGETRSCINIIDSSTGVQTELLEPGPTVEEEDLSKLIDLYEREVDLCDVITLSGSVLNGVKENIYRVLVEIARSKGKKVILDTSERYLVEGTKSYPTLVKPNVNEAEYLLGTKIRNVTDAKSAAKHLVKLGVQLAAISLGRDGAVVATEKRTYYAKAPSVQALNTVGSGDAMVAGFAVALARGYGVEEMLKLGVAVSAANAVTIETGSCKLEDIQFFLRQVAVTGM
ncbi:1-phosphofructokinase [Acididesulfobacillus acetoxydans]|uniref:Tagatose-6-phosphate kinase n=1 Tax=Acididesulfobacillus acetoxydans TaxID=1561005 RepID=A0A8S0XB86_9FIRM|nr:1-phosphofructokinase [Acididesulfobacillus acetoxydans]CAA7600906.1 1-phosphofructokinase [Acididesulfobacillus acetoxydans]CEJ08937.1 Tagatose-6-phosphate kinase [Acididesulfobacillus acetoxydans]